MSDERFALSVTAGFLAILLLWVPVLDLLQRFTRNHRRHKHKS
jgi:hypothetical protein